RAPASTPVPYTTLFRSRRLAERQLRSERSNHTLQPTALVNEAYMRLINQRAVTWQSRAQFVGLASQLMRRILIDHARARLRAKRSEEHTSELQSRGHLV